MDWRAFIPHGIAFGFFVGALLAVILIPIIRGRDARENKKRIAKAKDRILEDGKIEGPKGPYVPHRKWKDSGTPHFTDSETKPPRHGGYYGSG